MESKIINSSWKILAIESFSSKYPSALSLYIQEFTRNFFKSSKFLKQINYNFIVLVPERNKLLL